MKECPRCHEMTLQDESGRNALSRRDNKTYICNECGDEEAMIDLGEMPPGDIEREFLSAIGR